MMKLSAKLLVFIAAFALCSAGCFYPPTTVPPPDEKERTIVPLPFDLTWDVVNRVAKRDGLRIDVADPNNHNLELSGPRFTLQEADCGTIKSIAGLYAAQPEVNSTSVYNILVKPHGREQTMVEVAVSYNSPVKVPLRPATDVDCISRGTDESRFLKEVIAEAKITRRPDYSHPAPGAEPGAQAQEAPSPGGAATVRKPFTLPDPKNLYPPRSSGQ